jgi:hypothetical protein
MIWDIAFKPMPRPLKGRSILTGMRNLNTSAPVPRRFSVNQPVISVDTVEKGTCRQLLNNGANGNHGRSQETNVRDFQDKELGKVILMEV